VFLRGLIRLLACTATVEFDVAQRAAGTRNTPSRMISLAFAASPLHVAPLHYSQQWDCWLPFSHSSCPVRTDARPDLRRCGPRLSLTVVHRLLPGRRALFCLRCGGRSSAASIETKRRPRFVVEPRPCGIGCCSPPSPAGQPVQPLWRLRPLRPLMPATCWRAG
jgi:hypothetical protein